MENLLAILLAGGAGERLYPLTKDTAKPAVPFGGGYRIIDFTLSNCINSGVRRIFILTQYKSLELTRHIRNGWNILSPEVGEYIEMIPPMKRLRDDWYLGTADAVFQNSASIAAENCEYLLILAADHIYKMNYRDMLLRMLHEDSEDRGSSHDFGHDVIPKLLGKARVIAYNFVDMNAKEALYWRDVGTIDAYYEANMDLVSVSPEFNLYDERWPVRTGQTQQPPAKFVFAQEGRRMGVALDSIVCAGCVISGGRVVRSVLSP